MESSLSWMPHLANTYESVRNIDFMFRRPYYYFDQIRTYSLDEWQIASLPSDLRKDYLRDRLFSLFDSHELVQVVDELDKSYEENGALIALACTASCPSSSMRIYTYRLTASSDQEEAQIEYEWALSSGNDRLQESIIPPEADSLDTLASLYLQPESVVTNTIHRYLDQINTDIVIASLVARKYNNALQLFDYLNAVDSYLYEYILPEVLIDDVLEYEEDYYRILLELGDAALISTQDFTDVDLAIDFTYLSRESARIALPFISNESYAPLAINQCWDALCLLRDKQDVWHPITCTQMENVSFKTN